MRSRSVHISKKRECGCLACPPTEEGKRGGNRGPSPFLLPAGKKEKKTVVSGQSHGFFCRKGGDSQVRVEVSTKRESLTAACLIKGGKKLRGTRSAPGTARMSPPFASAQGAAPPLSGEGGGEKRGGKGEDNCISSREKKRSRGAAIPAWVGGQKKKKKSPPRLRS